MRIQLVLLLLGLMLSCSQPKVKSIGDVTIPVFKNTNLYFDMALKQDTLTPKDDILRLDAGRVLLKKVKLPKYELQPEVRLQVSLTSNGDPWDKSGSLFVIPTTADLSVLDIENKAVKKTQFLDSFPGIKTTEIANKIYKPSIELLRFMTPFGVGYFNTDKRVEALKPVYIPRWEEEVVWKQDITHLLPVLEDEVYIGVFIDTWTKQGYNISVDLTFEESKIPNHKKYAKSIMPIINTIKYSADQKYYDEFSRQDLRVDFHVDKPLKNAKLYYTTTGHGGHEDGDEFTRKENRIMLDQKLIKQFVPWRDDCASFRRFNPTSGVWTETTTWKDKTIEERIASSDYSRSNWCPGSDVVPEIIDLGDIESGEHEIVFSIPEAQAIIDDKINYWMVSAYIVYEE